MGREIRQRGLRGTFSGIIEELKGVTDLNLIQDDRVALDDVTGWRLAHNEVATVWLILYLPPLPDHSPR